MPKQEKIKVNVKERIDDNTVDLSLSELTEVPIRDIASFKRVVNVDLSNNKIISLGKNISLLSHITKLDLSKNELKYLPDDFGSLKSLRHLDLYNNRLEHLPLSFGNLQNLKYLDLKTNPLTPALAKIVGPCLTTKDCNESAKNTVKFLKEMLIVYENGKKLSMEENAEQQEIETNNKKVDIQKSKKKNKKSKSRKSKNNHQQNGLNKDDSLNINTKNVTKIDEIDDYDDENYIDSNSKTALTTVLIFFLLLTINIFVIYILTVKNPEIAEKIAEIIPEKYRDIILSKTENMKVNFLRISDYLQQFRTPTADDYPNYIEKPT